MSKNQKIDNRTRKKKHIRKQILGNTGRPRMTVFKSNKHIYAQIIDDSTHKTVIAASDEKIDSKKKLKKTEKAVEVGKTIAEKALASKIDTIVFDRNGFKYHGRVKALADAAREAGLKF